MAKADPKDDLIKACDSALTLCDKALIDLKGVNAVQLRMIESLTKENDRLKDDRHGILNNTTLWFVLGAVTIGFVGSAFSK